MPDRYLPIGEAAAYLGVAIATLRRWEETGKLHPRRNALGQREYTIVELDALRGATLPPATDILTIKQAATRLGSSTKTIRRLIGKGKLNTIATGKFGEILLSAQQIDALLSHTPLPTANPIQIDIPEQEVEISKETTVTQETPQQVVYNNLSQNTSPEARPVSNAKPISMKKLVLANEISLLLFSSVLGAALFFGLSTDNELISNLRHKTLASLSSALQIPQGAMQSVNNITQVIEKLEGEFLALRDGNKVDTALEFENSTNFDDVASFNSGLAIRGNLFSISGNRPFSTNGKVLSLTSSYFENLDGSELTNVNAEHLGGVQASGFLRSNEPDTAEAVITFTASPGSMDVNGGSVYINPSGTSFNYTLFGIAVNGNQKFKVDSEGDTQVAGNLSVDGTSLLTGATTLSSTLSVAGTTTLSGNTSVGGTLGVTGATTLSSTLNVTGATTLTSLTATGQGIFTRVPSVAHTGTWAQDSGTWGVSDSTLYINPASVTADSNLLGLAVAGGVKFAVDAEGDIYAGNLILTGSTSSGTTTIAGDLTVEGNTTLGDAGSDTFTIYPNTITLANTTATKTIAAAGTQRLDLTANSATLSIGGTSGNIGIGTTSPTQKLNVNGNVVVGNTALGGTVGAGASSTPFVFETAADTSNTAVSALYIYPQDEAAHRIFLGKSGRSIYALNLTNISSAVESFPRLLSAASHLTISLGYGSTLSLRHSPTNNSYIIPGDGGATDALNLDNDGYFWFKSTMNSSATAKGYVFDTTQTRSAGTIVNVRDNGTDLFVIDHAGNVGVGTTSPSAKLDVQGRILGTSDIDLTGSPASGKYLLIEGTSTVAGNLMGVFFAPTINANSTDYRGFQSVPTIATGITVTNGYGAYISNPTESGTGSVGTNYGLYLESQTAGNTNYSIYSAGGTNYFAGNVGIGTTAPTSGYELEIRATSGNVDVKETYSDGSVALVHGATSTIGYLGTGTNHPLRLQVNNSDKLTIDTGGNVGIGTTTPADKLNVVNSTDGVGGVAVRNLSTGSSAYSTIYLGNSTWPTDTVLFNVGTNNTSYGGARSGGIGNNSVAPFVFITNSLERMRIDSGGNVGIGTTSPAGILHVSGTTSIFGVGEAGTPTATTIRGAAASGTNISGANLTIDASNGTGTGGSGALVYRTSPSDFITFDTASSSGTNPDSTTLKWRHTTGGGPNRILVVGVASRSVNITSVTYAGVTMTNIAEVSPGDTRAELWYLINPPAGNHEIFVTAASSGTITAGAVTYYNAAQSSPIRASNTATGTSANPSVTLSGTSAAGDLVVDILALQSAQASTPPGSGQVERVDIQGTANHASMNEETATSSTVTMDRTISLDTWAMIAASIKPFTTSPTTTMANTLTEQLRLTSNGLLGVGTSSPTSKLTVNGDLSILSGGGLAMQNHSGNAFAYIENTGTSTNSQLDFTTTSSSVVTTKMTLTAAGNLGIGTTTPAQKLDIAGNIAFSGIAQPRIIGGSTNFAINNNANTTNNLLIVDGGSVQLLGTTPTLFINDSSNANMTMGLTINQAGNDDEILALKSSDVAHGVTNNAETDTFGLFRKQSTTAGGLRIDGFSEVAGSGILLVGVQTNDDLGKTTSAGGAVTLQGATKSGSGTAALGTNANIVVIHDGGGTRFIFDKEGTGHADDVWTDNAFDLAEDYPTVQGAVLEPGDVVSVVENPGKVNKSTYPYDQAILGVVSYHTAQLSATLSNDEPRDEYGNLLNHKPIALTGRVPVKVSLENGPIKRGDYLTSSSTPGFAMKAKKAGAVIGKALEDYEGEGSSLEACNDKYKRDYYAPTPSSGACQKVMAFITVSYADPNNVLSQLTLDSSGNVVIPKLASEQITITNNQETNNLTINLESKLADLTEKLGLLEDKVLALETEDASSSAVLGESTESASLITALPYTLSISEENNLTINNNLSVLGETSLGDTSITGTLNVGLLSIENVILSDSEGSLTSLTALNTLLFQNAYGSGVEIDTHGNVKVNAELTAEKLNISGDSLGSAIISRGQTEITLSNENVTSTSKIFITPSKAINIAVSARNVTNKTFTVSLSNIQTTDVTFDYWIVDND